MFNHFPQSNLFSNPLIPLHNLLQFKLLSIEYFQFLHFLWLLFLVVNFMHKHGAVFTFFLHFFFLLCCQCCRAVCVSLSLATPFCLRGDTKIFDFLQKQGARGAQSPAAGALLECICVCVCVCLEQHFRAAKQTADKDKAREGGEKNMANAM